MNGNNKKKIYVRPEDVLELLLNKIRKCKTKEQIEESIVKMLQYFKTEKYNRLIEEFDLVL